LARLSSNRLPCDVVKWFRMISANVIKGVHELLEERGIRPEPNETFGDMVARALDISRRQSEILLEAHPSMRLSLLRRLTLPILREIF
jgi:hypothetical protein